jgi:hypothetical protein
MKNHIFIEESVPETSFLPITETEPTEPDWVEVVRLLQFEKSYTQGRKYFANPESMVQTYIEKITTGVTYQELGKKYGVGAESISNANKAVARAVSCLFGPPPLESFSEDYLRVIDIYNAYTLLPGFISYHKEAETEIGLLLSENIGLEFLLQYLATGKNITDYSREYNLSGISKSNAYGYSKSFSKALLEGVCDKRSFEKLVRLKLYRNFLDSNVDIHNNDVFWYFKHFTKRMLNSTGKTKGPEQRGFAYGVRSFLNLSIFSHYYDSTDLSEFKDLATDINNPYTIDENKYYDYYFKLRQIPPGIRMFLEASINLDEHGLYKRIARHHRYKVETLERSFAHGYKYFENLLMLPTTNHHVPMEYFMRSRRAEALRLFELMTVEFQSYKQSCLGLD